MRPQDQSLAAGQAFEDLDCRAVLLSQLHPHLADAALVKTPDDVATVATLHCLGGNQYGASSLGLRRSLRFQKYHRAGHLGSSEGRDLGEGHLNLHRGLIAIGRRTDQPNRSRLGASRIGIEPDRSGRTDFNQMDITLEDVHLQLQGREIRHGQHRRTAHGVAPRRGRNDLPNFSLLAQHHTGKGSPDERVLSQRAGASQSGLEWSQGTQLRLLPGLGQLQLPSGHGQTRRLLAIVCNQTAHPCAHCVPLRKGIVSPVFADRALIEQGLLPDRVSLRLQESGLVLRPARFGGGLRGFRLADTCPGELGGLARGEEISLSALKLCLGGGHIGIQILMLQLGKDLPGLDAVALVHVELGEPAQDLATQRGGLSGDHMTVGGGQLTARAGLHPVCLDQYHLSLAARRNLLPEPEHLRPGQQPERQPGNQGEYRVDQQTMRWATGWGTLALINCELGKIHCWLPDGYPRRC